MQFKNLTLPMALFISLTFAFSCQSPNPVQDIIKSAEERPDSQNSQAKGSQYAISTQGAYATQAAKKMYDLGGNIIDATVAASFTIAVERPQSTGIGGGGFLVFFDAKTQVTHAVDFRERAPLAAHEHMFIKDKKADPDLSQNGALAVATPGLVAGLLEVHQKFGSLSRAQVLQPAIELAEEGFTIYPELERALEYRQAELAKDPEAKKIFLDQNSKALTSGTLLVQKDLGKTLRQIAKLGKKGFYQGSFAKHLIGYSKKNGGILSAKDLETYQVKWRKPLSSPYKGLELLSMPPPSSGGVHVIQFLKFLEPDLLPQKGLLSAQAIHLSASALQSAFADRAQYLGDPDFVEVPVDPLISSKYISKRRGEISVNRARKASEVKAGTLVLPKESTETTHISIIDQEGNAVSTTQTINGWMGAARVVPKTGVVLNNEMDDFSAQPGASNLFGAIGGKPNAIAPLKTPLSSMSPTILVQDGKAQMAIGAPGGTRIISCVAQTILNYYEFKLPLYEAISTIRYHHQWLPDTLFLEPPGPKPSVLRQLQELGYSVQIEPIPCNVMATVRQGSDLIGVADPRDIGTSVAK